MRYLVKGHDALDFFKRDVGKNNNKWGCIREDWSSVKLHDGYMGVHCIKLSMCGHVFKFS